MVIVTCALGFFGGVPEARAGANRWTSSGPEGGQVEALAIDPATPTTLYAGTSDGGIFKSTNAGASWSALNTGLTNPFVRALAIDPYAGTFAEGVFRSDSGGASWSPVNTGLANNNVFTLAIDPATPATLYAGTLVGGGVFRSDSGGTSWSAVNTGLDGSVDPGDLLAVAVQAFTIPP